MTKIKNFYIKSLQNHQDRCLIRASIWTFRTIRDLRSVGIKNSVLTCADRTAIFFRGFLALLAWLPVNILAIPYTFILGAMSRKSKAAPQLHEIVPGLFVGTDQAARSAETLKKHDITSVLSVIDFDVDVPDGQVAKKKRISIEDYPHVDISQAVRKAVKFVELSKSEGRNVLVHCNMGQSRSAGIVAGVIQNLKQVDSRTAINIVKKGRPCVHINYGFKKQLQRGNYQNNS